MTSVALPLASFGRKSVTAVPLGDADAVQLHAPGEPAHEAARDG